MNRISTFVKENPVFLYFVAFCTVFSIPLSIYLFYKGTKAPELTYQVNTTRTSIVKAGNTDGLKVSFGGKEIQGDISSAQIEIWNKGKQAIQGDQSNKTSDILEPIEIISKNHVKILEAKIIKTTRPLTSVKLDNSKLDNGVVGISWKILENNDACVIQLIYAGGLDEAFTLNGTIEGQQKLFVSTVISKEQTESNFRFSLGFFTFVFMILSIRLILYTKFGHIFKPDEKPTDPLGKWLKRFETCSYGFLLLVCLLNLFNLWPRFMTNGSLPLPF